MANGGGPLTRLTAIHDSYGGLLLQIVLSFWHPDQRPPEAMNANRTNIFTAAALIAGILAGAVLVSAPASAADPLNPSPNCSPLDPGPCTPSICGVFSGSPCVPYMLPPIGQDLHLTIVSGNDDHGRAPDQPVNSIGELFAALRGCWEPPPHDNAHRNIQMSVRFAFRRSGEIIGEPRVTYTSKDADDDARRNYHDAVTAALKRCSPMPFTDAMAGAIAGRPIAVRFVDDRGSR